MTAQNRIRVCYFQRKRRPNGHYSLEAIFADVRRRLNDKIEIQVRLAPCYSNGIIRRIWIMLDAALHQSQVNHVTGDNDFTAILLSSRRTVMTVLDCGYMARTRGVRRWLLKTFWLKLPVHRAKVVTAISKATKQEIVAVTSCDPEKIRVVPVAISANFSRYDKPFNTDCPRILQIGTKANKNVPRLIQALAGIPCRLVIVGPISREIRLSLDQANIPHELLVDLSEQEVIEQYKLCDLVSFVSTFEGFGMPIVEAQTIGRAVITSACSSMPEVAGPDACLVDPLSVQSIRNGILRLIQDQAYRERVVDSGLSNAQRFNGDTIAAQYLSIYQELVADR